MHMMYYIFYLLHIVCLCNLWHLQSNFNPKDIPYRNMHTMSNCLIKAILPDEQIIKVDLHQGLFLCIKLLIIFLYWKGYDVYFMGFPWSILRLEEGCWWRQLMVVHQQLGPEVGHQPRKCLMTMVKNRSKKSKYSKCTKYTKYTLAS